MTETKAPPPSPTDGSEAMLIRALRLLTLMIMVDNRQRFIPPERATRSTEGQIGVTVDDAQRTQQTADVLRLLDESFRAHRAGDKATADRAAQEACQLDVDCVSVVQGGILIGEIPNPERDPVAWADYVQAAQDQARTPGE